MSIDGPGFHVEPDVLERVARGMRDTVRDQDGAELAELAGAPARYGHDGVHAGFAEFCRSWTVGVDALCDRARWMGTSLADAAAAYRSADLAAARALRRDPALEEVRPDDGW